MKNSTTGHAHRLPFWPTAMKLKHLTFSARWEPRKILVPFGTPNGTRAKQRVPRISDCSLKTQLCWPALTVAWMMDSILALTMVLIPETVLTTDELLQVRRI